MVNGKDNSIAAIASELAAKIYSLKILEKNIEDETGNVTRFLIMGKNVNQPEYEKKKDLLRLAFLDLKVNPQHYINPWEDSRLIKLI